MVNCTREEEEAKEAGPAPDALHHHGLGADASGEPAFEEYGFDTVRFIGNNYQDKGVGRLCIRQRWVESMHVLSIIARILGVSLILLYIHT